MLLLALAACHPPLAVTDPPVEDSAADTDVVTYVMPVGRREVALRSGHANHLLPYDLVVDPAARRAYSLSLAFGNIGVVDLDSAELVEVIPVLTDDPPSFRAARGGTQRLGLGSDGAVWILGGDPALTRVDPVAGTVVSVPTDLAVVASFLARADGAVILGGAVTEEEPRIDVLDASFALVASWPTSEVARALLPIDDTTFAVLLRSGAIEIRRLDDGSVVGSCPSQQEGTAFAALPGGDFVVIDGTRTSLVPCTGGAPATLTEGLDQQAVIALSEGVLVLDRQSGAPHRAAARRYDASLSAIGAAFPTGNHTGYGGLDPSTGTVWANAEGSTEVIAIDPVAGTVVARVGMGDHVEEAVRDPSNADRAFVVGRLTDTFEAVDLATGTVTPIEGPPWPMSPAVVGRTVFVVGGIDQRLYAFDADTLEFDGSWDLGFGPNHGYTLPDLAWDEPRGLLFVSGGDDGRIAAFDPQSRVVVGTPIGLVPRGFPSDVVNRLEVRIGAEAVYLVRAGDGVIGRLAPETGEVTHGDALVGVIEAGTRMSLSAMGPDGTLWVGPYALDPVTLERAPAPEAPWTFPIGPDGDAMFGWDAASQSIVRVGPGGTVEARWEAGPFGNADPTLEVRGGRVLFTHLRDATLYDWPLE